MNYSVKKSISDYIEKHMNVPVFFISSFLIFVLAFIGVFFSQQLEDTILYLNKFLITQFNWLIVLTMTVFFVLSIYLYFSKFRNIKLGGDYSEPEYSYTAWIAMLFSAGMGIGILFYGVAEPITHYVDHPIVEGSKETNAMKYTFLHWGLHAWATYVIVGLALAYVGFRRQLPFSFRFTFYPLLKDKVYKWPGHTIDIFAVVATLFGVATSLGLGAIQINTGLNYLFGVENNLTTKIAIIMLIISLATFSVITGVKKGIKWFSIINISLGAFLMIFVLLFGPTLHILQQFLISAGVYIKDFIDLTLVKTLSINSSWLSGWTLFYWAWWISWAPYVGMFIARISKGRTIKEFIFGVLVIPTVLTLLWFTIFGSSAISLFGDSSEQTSMILEDESKSLFLLLEQLPWGDIINLLGVILIITFFVTSSDSGSFVMDLITSGGKCYSVKAQRAFWSVLQGLTACVLLIGGGLIALQTTVITMAIPFSVILLLMCWSLLKGLQTEYDTQNALRRKNLDDLKAEVKGCTPYSQQHPVKPNSITDYVKSLKK